MFALLTFKIILSNIFPLPTHKARKVLSVTPGDLYYEAQQINQSFSGAINCTVSGSGLHRAINGGCNAWSSTCFAGIIVYPYDE